MTRCENTLSFDMMQVDVVHCCQVEKEVAILEVEEEVCIAQMAVEEEEGSDAVETSDAASLPLVEACCHLFSSDGSLRCSCLSSKSCCHLFASDGSSRCRCLSSRLCCHLFSLMAPM